MNAQIVNALSHSHVACPPGPIAMTPRHHRRHSPQKVARDGVAGTARCICDLDLRMEAGQIKHHQTASDRISTQDKPSSDLNSSELTRAHQTPIRPPSPSSALISPHQLASALVGGFQHRDTAVGRSSQRPGRAMRCARWDVHDGMCAMGCARWDVHNAMCTMGYTRWDVHDEICTMGCAR